MKEYEDAMKIVQEDQIVSKKRILEENRTNGFCVDTYKVDALDARQRLDATKTATNKRLEARNVAIDTLNNDSDVRDRFLETPSTYINIRRAIDVCHKNDRNETEQAIDPITLDILGEMTIRKDDVKKDNIRFVKESKQCFNETTLSKSKWKDPFTQIKCDRSQKVSGSNTFNNDKHTYYYYTTDGDPEQRPMRRPRK